MSYHTLTGKNGYVYILSNYRRTVLYIGVTSNLIDRIRDHRKGNGTVFTKKYRVKYLLYFEKYPNINEAIYREKELKNWHREWKLNLIKDSNPDMKDLWHELIKK